MIPWRGATECRLESLVPRNLVSSARIRVSRFKLDECDEWKHECDESLRALNRFRAAPRFRVLFVDNDNAALTGFVVPFPRVE
jgi:hypothetical protein